MDIIHGFIYALKPASEQSRDPRFFHRHKYKLGIILSIFLHIGLFGWIFYQGVIAPFTDMSFVDEAYNEVKWIEVTKLAKPLKYPVELLPNPAKAVPLNELDEELLRERAAEKAREEARKKDEARKKKEREELARKKREAAKDDTDTDETDETDETADAKLTTPLEPPKLETPVSTQPKFGLINARPIKDIVGKVYAVYKSGGLDLARAVFSVTVGYEVRPDGSLENVRIIKSSGSQQIDSSALNIANAISESHALMPLAALTANTATLDLNDEIASLKISGSAISTTVASELSTTFSQQLAGLQLLMNFKNKDAAVLLSHLEVSHENNRLIANLHMTRAEASALMQKNFGNLIPATNKQPEAINENLKDVSTGSAAF